MSPASYLTAPPRGVVKMTLAGIGPGSQPPLKRAKNPTWVPISSSCGATGSSSEHVGKLAPRRYVELAKGAAQVRLDGLLGNEKRLRDLAIGAARRRKLDDAALAW